MKIDKEELYRLYMEQVDIICEECDWVTNFTPKDIVNLISDIIEENPNLIENE